VAQNGGRAFRKVALTEHRLEGNKRYRFEEDYSMTNHDNETPLSMAAMVESILFVAAEPVPVPLLASALDTDDRAVEDALESLEQEYRARGLKILRMGDRVHITSAPRAAQVVEKFLGMEHTIGLSRAALETLAILAYKQPLTRPQIDSVRGVNSDSVLDNLMAKGLVEEMGRTEGPGRPILYATTADFLRHFGLGSTAELPALDLDEPMKDIPADPVADGVPILKE
jgi:segregation and condensation protein B